MRKIAPKKSLGSQIINLTSPISLPTRHLANITNTASTSSDTQQVIPSSIPPAQSAQTVQPNMETIRVSN